MKCPEDRLYTPDHVWIAPDGRVGVTPRLIEAVPQIVRAHLPAIGEPIRVATPFGALEAEKAAYDVYAPCDGVILAVNDAVIADPEVLRQAPFDAWLVRIECEAVPLWSADRYLRTATASPHGRARK